MRVWYLPRAVALAALIGLTAGCTPAQLYGNAQEAGAAAKDYVDERTDRREDLRLRQYAIQDSIIGAHLRRAQRDEMEGDLDAAVAGYEAALAQIERFYPDLESLSAEVRATIAALRGQEDTERVR
jgi:hypothetical protein